MRASNTDTDKLYLTKWLWHVKTVRTTPNQRVCWHIILQIVGCVKGIRANASIRLKSYLMNMDFKPKIRVMVVDDTDIVRRGLGIALSTFEDIILVGEAANGQEAVARVAHLKPDIILMDLVMPVMDGIQATEIIVRLYANIKIVVLTSTTDMDMIEAALAKGAAAYLFKNISLLELETAIHSAYQAEMPS